jgi:hypothetical protein
MIKNANFVLAFSLPGEIGKKHPQGAFVNQGGRQIRGRTGLTMPCLAGIRVKLLFHMLVHNGVQMFRFVQTA